MHAPWRFSFSWLVAAGEIEPVTGKPFGKE
jgi:hypothetical protein